MKRARLFWTYPSLPILALLIRAAVFCRKSGHLFLSIAKNYWERPKICYTIGRLIRLWDSRSHTFDFHIFSNNKKIISFRSHSLLKIFYTSATIDYFLGSRSNHKLFLTPISVSLIVWRRCNGRYIIHIKQTWLRWKIAGHLKSHLFRSFLHRKQ